MTSKLFSADLSAPTTHAEIIYKDDFGVWPLIQKHILDRLPLRDVKWKGVKGTRIIPEVNVHVEEQNELKTVPSVYIYLVLCEDHTVYMNSIKPRIKQWVNQFINQEWIIVNVMNEAKKFLNIKVSVLDKIKQDFIKERAIGVRLDPDSLDEFMQRIKERLVFAFEATVIQQKEEIQRMDAQRKMPGWNFGLFFEQKEKLALTYESMNLFDEALILYDELEAVFMESKSTFEFGDGEYLLFSNFKRETYFDFRMILISKQLDLQSKTSIMDVMRRTQEFLIEFRREMKLNNVLDLYQESFTLSFVDSVLTLVEKVVFSLRLSTAKMSELESSKLNLILIACCCMDAIGASLYQKSYLFSSKKSTKTELKNKLYQYAAQSKEEFINMFMHLVEVGLAASKLGCKEKVTWMLKSCYAGLMMDLNKWEESSLLLLDLTKNYTQWCFLELDILYKLLFCYKKLEKEYAEIALNIISIEIKNHLDSKVNLDFWSCNYETKLEPFFVMLNMEENKGNLKLILESNLEIECFVSVLFLNQLEFNGKFVLKKRKNVLILQCLSQPCGTFEANELTLLCGNIKFHHKIQNKTIRLDKSSGPLSVLVRSVSSTLFLLCLNSSVQCMEAEITLSSDFLQKTIKIKDFTDQNLEIECMEFQTQLVDLKIEYFAKKKYIYKSKELIENILLPLFFEFKYIQSNFYLLLTVKNDLLSPIFVNEVLLFVNCDYKFEKQEREFILQNQSATYCFLIQNYKENVEGIVQIQFNPCLQNTLDLVRQHFNREIHSFEVHDVVKKWEKSIQLLDWNQAVFENKIHVPFPIKFEPKFCQLFKQNLNVCLPKFVIKYSIECPSQTTVKSSVKCTLNIEKHSIYQGLDLKFEIETNNIWQIVGIRKKSFFLESKVSFLFSLVSLQSGKHPIPKVSFFSDSLIAVDYFFKTIDVVPVTTSTVIILESSPQVLKPSVSRSTDFSQIL